MACAPDPCAPTTMPISSSSSSPFFFFFASHAYHRIFIPCALIKYPVRLTLADFNATDFSHFDRGMWCKGSLFFISLFVRVVVVVAFEENWKWIEKNLWRRMKNGRRLLFREYERERFFIRRYIYIIHDGCYYIILCCCSINTLARFICALPRGARVFFFFDTCSP